LVAIKISSFVRKLIQYCFSLLLLFSPPLSVSAQSDQAKNQFLAVPGKLVDIGTHRLHINCKGYGSPTIIIDSGLGSFSLEWSAIQESLKDDVRVCTYDRAGYGWSDTGPFPRTTRQIANELNLLLEKAVIPGPYVLVGHSFGGYNIRYFASEHPQSVAGIVLIDSSHPDQFERLPQKNHTGTKSGHKGKTYRIIKPVIHVNYPENFKQMAYLLARTSKAKYTQLSELDNMRDSAGEVRQKTTFPNVPLVVVSRGKRVWPDTYLGDRLETAWKEMQAELTYLTNMSVQILANNSGHSIHLDQPGLVSYVIKKTVSSTRKIEDKRIASLYTNESSGRKQPFYPLNDYFEIPMVGALIVKANYKDRVSSLRYLESFK